MNPDEVNRRVEEAKKVVAQTLSQGATPYSIGATEVRDGQGYVSPTSVGATPLASAMDSTASIPTLEATLAAEASRREADARLKAAQVSTKETENKGILNTITNLVRNRPSEATLLANERAKYGVEQTFQDILALTPEIDSLRNQLNALDAEEKNQTNALTGQGRGIPQVILDAQGAKIQREYASRKAAVSAQLTAKAALQESMRGNISLATSLATQAVNASVYDAQQQVDDYTNLYNFNKGIIDNLDTESKNTLNSLYTEAKTNLATLKTEKSDVAKLAMDNPAAKVDIYNDTLKTAQEKVANSGGSLAARQEARLASSKTPTVYDAGNLPPTMRNDILDDIKSTDLTTKASAAGITPFELLVRVYPEVDYKTLQTLYDQFYVKPAATSTKAWWQFWK